MKKLLFATANCRKMAVSLCRRAGLKKGRCKIGRFADREILVQVLDDVSGAEIFVVGSTNPPADNLLELFFLVHALKVNGAIKIHLLMPYFAYAKADEIKPKGTALSAKFVAEALRLAGVGDIAVLDLHSKKALSYLTMPVKELSAMELLAQSFKKMRIRDLAIASPDAGGIERAKRFAKELGLEKIIKMKKKRPGFDRVQVESIQGDVRGKNVIIVDDMVQSGGTLVKAASALKKAGAKKVFAAVTHLLPSGPAIELLKNDANFELIFVTNALPVSKALAKIRIVPVEPLLAAVLKLWQE